MALEAYIVDTQVTTNTRIFIMLALIGWLLGSTCGLCADAPAKPQVIRVHESRTNLLLFPTGNEVFLGALGSTNPDLFIAGSAGTALSIDHDRLVFHTGQLFLNSGKSTLTIGTRLANVRLAPDTTIVLDIHPHKPLHVALLSGTSPIHFKAKDRRTPIILKSGEELFVSDAVLPSEQYTSTDPLPRLESSKETGTKGLELIKRNFDARKVLAWHVNEINNKEKLGSDKKAYLDKIYSSAGSPTNNLSNDPWHVLAAGATEFTLLPINTGVIHLRSGELFIYAPTYTIIETPLGDVHGEKGSIYAVDTADGNLRTRALTGPGDVTVVTGKHKLPVPPGEEVMVSDHNPTKEDTNPTDGIARRNPKTKSLDNKLSVTVADFNILSLLVSADYLKPIKKPFWTQEQSALEKLIRTAAAIETITQSKGAYTGTPRKTPNHPKANPGLAI